MKNKWALVSDFDGTISDEDFFWYVVNNYLKPQDLAPWNRYLAGEMTHLDALSAIFSQIHIPTADLQKFIRTIKVDKTFALAAELCNSRNIPIYIASAGCDYYILQLISAIISDYDITLVTNHGCYTPENGLKLYPPKDSPFYDDKVGISKAAVVKNLQDKGYKVILAGDGKPDLEPARISDEVFAKKHLLELCNDAKITTRNFSDFTDVANFIKEL